MRSHSTVIMPVLITICSMEEKQAKQPVDCNAQLASTCLFTPTLCRGVTRKVGQTDVVFDVRAGFVSRSVHARLQVSACDG